MDNSIKFYLEGMQEHAKEKEFYSPDVYSFLIRSDEQLKNEIQYGNLNESQIRKLNDQNVFTESQKQIILEFGLGRALTPNTAQSPQTPQPSVAPTNAYPDEKTQASQVVKQKAALAFKDAWDNKQSRALQAMYNGQNTGAFQNDEQVKKSVEAIQAWMNYLANHIKVQYKLKF
jgi:hypothetical protein